MKLVKEHINEKFTDESDPVKDLGIGLEAKLKKFKEELYANVYNINMKKEYDNDNDMLWIASKYGKLELVKYLLDKGANIHRLSDRALRWSSKNNYYDIVKYLLEHGANVHAYEDSALRLATENHNDKIISLLKSYGSTYKPFTGYVSEKFIADSDPIHDMNIGIKHLIKNWFLSWNGVTEEVFNRHIQIDENNEINVIGCGITFTNRVKGSIPEFIQFNRIEGNFNISNCSLTTLRGCPHSVGGNFKCNNNNIASLEYSPKVVEGNFDISNNAKQFTEEEIIKICRVDRKVFV